MLSNARLPVSAVNQVCIAVNNLQKTMEDYWNILGIGPWSVFNYGTPEISDFKCYGISAQGRCRVAVVKLGAMELKLVETIEGTSIYRDWISVHGESLHHVKFLVEDLDIDRVRRVMESLGFPDIMSGHIGTNGEGQFACFDTRKALHAIWETSSHICDKPEGATNFPKKTEAVSPAKVKVERIRQVALCVKDAVRTAQNYWNILGIGPWSIFDWGTHVLERRLYHGKPSWGREIVAFAYIGDVQLELVQPVEGDSIYADWMSVHGEGLHHLKFLCDDVDEVSAILTSQGFPSILSGHYGLPGGKAGGYNYIDIPPLHCIWEPVQEPVVMPAEPFLTFPGKLHQPE